MGSVMGPSMIRAVATSFYDIKPTEHVYNSSAGLIFGDTSMNITEEYCIDTHHHFMPQMYVSEIGGAEEIMAATVVGSQKRSVPSWSVERSLSVMDSNNISASILSISAPGVWMGEGQEVASQKLARDCNEYSAHLVRDNPTRFGMFASLPLPDTRGSLRELEYALGDLNADGVVLMTNYDDRYLGDPAFSPVFEELNRRKAVVFVHPRDCVCLRGLVPEVPTSFIEFGQDTTRTIMSLLFSGAFKRFPDIKFIFSHAGGTLPMLAHRIELLQKLFIEEDLKYLSDGVMSILQKLHYDVASSANDISLAALLKMVPVSQILFGSDFPFIPEIAVEKTIEGIGALGLSQEDSEAIYHRNAERLFPRFSR